MGIDSRLTGCLEQEELVSRCLGIVGSWEKGAEGADISLEKFLFMGEVEVFCPIDDYLDFSLSIGATVETEKAGHFWRGEIILSRTGYLTNSPEFTPSDFARTVGNDPVGIYIVRLSPDTPVTEEIIGATAYLT